MLWFTWVVHAMASVLLQILKYGAFTCSHNFLWIYRYSLVIQISTQSVLNLHHLDPFNWFGHVLILFRYVFYACLYWVVRINWHLTQRPSLASLSSMRQTALSTSKLIAYLKLFGRIFSRTVLTLLLQLVNLMCIVCVLSNLMCLDSFPVCLLRKPFWIVEVVITG